MKGKEGMKGKGKGLKHQRVRITQGIYKGRIADVTEDDGGNLRIVILSKAIEILIDRTHIIPI